MVEPVARALAKLLESLQRRPRLRRELCRLGFQHLPRKLARLVQVAGATQHGHEPRRSVRGVGEL